MSSGTEGQGSAQVVTQPRANTTALLGITATVMAVHILTNHRYGFHRDELQILSDAVHLDWGFVEFPPLTPLLERISLGVFGLSLVGLRLFSVITQGLAILVTGLMAWELGGRRLAQVAAALAIALSPLSLFEGTEFQYTTFDYLWWVLAAYFVIRLLKTENPRWWLAIGAAVGVGLMTKYTMTFLAAGILAGLLLTRRRFFRSWWLWGGAALALLVFLPNLVWQVNHQFISLRFLSHIHVRDIGEGRTKGFVPDQFLVCTNLFAAPLWIGGVLAFLRDRRYRFLAWMFLVPLALLWIGKGRGYYMAAAYPPLMAMGAAAGDRWAASLSRRRRQVMEGAFFSGLAAYGLLACALVLPLASSGALVEFTLKNNGDLREEIGWDDLAKTVAQIRDDLPPEQRADVGVVVGNYGEAGAIEILGRAYHLPAPISGTNTAWLRGYPMPPPTTLIVVGLSRRYADRTFSSCRLAGRNGNRYGVVNEESRDHPDIFVCGPPRLPWAGFWEHFQNFG